MEGAPPNDDLKFCAERGKLLDQLHFAASDYCEALGELSRAIPEIDTESLRLRREKVQDSRLATEAAHAALVEHQDEHGC